MAPNNNRGVVTDGGTTTHQERRCQDAEDMKDWEHNVGLLILSIKARVGREFFPKCPFLIHAADEQLGSEWQKKVCACVRVPANKVADFWLNRKGLTIARDTLNRRRMNATGSMKKVFKSKWGGGGCHEMGVVVVSKTRGNIMIVCVLIIVTWIFSVVLFHCTRFPPMQGCTMQELKHGQTLIQFWGT